MRPTDEISCEVPSCCGTITSDNQPFVAETGVCDDHAACPKCHAIGTMSINKRNMDKTPYAKCTVCAHYFPLHQYADVMLPYWSSMMGVLHRNEFDWTSGSIVQETNPDTPPCLLKFESVWSDVWGSVVPNRADAQIDQVFEKVPLDWIAQDYDYLYVPYQKGWHVAVKKYLRDVRRYVPTFVALPVIEVHIDTANPEYQAKRQEIKELSVNGEKK